MKKLGAVLVVLVVISCSGTIEQRMKESITTEFKKEINDSTTFELESIEIKKTFNVADRKTTFNEEHLKEIIELGMDDYANQMRIEIEFLKSKDTNEIAVFYVDFVIREYNSSGEKVLNDYSATVLNDELFSVVHIKSMNY